MPENSYNFGKSGITVVSHMELKQIVEKIDAIDSKQMGAFVMRKHDSIVLMLQVNAINFSFFP